MLVLVGVSILAPRASVDIFKVEGPASCPGNIGSGLFANSTTGFSLSAFESGTLNLNLNVASLGGTEDFVFVNDTGATATNLSFTFSFTPLASNAQCQIANSHGVTVTSWFDACTVTDALGQSTSLGGAQINNLTSPVTVMFSGPGVPAGDSFQLDFVSLQGPNTVGTVTSVSPVPEPASLTVMGAGLFALGFVANRLRTKDTPR